MKFRNKQFLLEQLPPMLRQLQGDQAPNFGLMTARHMVEHLIWVTKVMSRKNGEPPAELTKSQLYFKQFVANGCPFEYRPKEGVTKDNLNPLKYANLEEAIAVLEDTNRKLYELLESNPDYKSYNQMTGEFNGEELDMFMGQHARWHSYQFGLLAAFAPMEV